MLSISARSISFSLRLSLSLFLYRCPYFMFVWTNDPLISHASEFKILSKLILKSKNTSQKCIWTYSRNWKTWIGERIISHEYRRICSLNEIHKIPWRSYGWLPSQHSISLVTCLHLLHIILYCLPLHFYLLLVFLFISMLAISFIEEIESIEAIAFHEHLNIRSNTLLFLFLFVSTLKWKQQQNSPNYRVVCYGLFCSMCSICSNIHLSVSWIHSLQVDEMKNNVYLVVLLFYKNSLQCSSVATILHVSSIISLYDSE